MSERRKLNLLALARRDKPFMSQFVADPGYTFVSADLSAGEPTVISHYSRDKNFFDATFGMVGKVPYYDGDLLKIDDVYLTGMSFSPMAADMMLELFHSKFGSMPFPEYWAHSEENRENIKSNVIAKPRKLHKGLILGLGYMMGAKKLAKTAYDAGEIISIKDCKTFKANYWAWCSDVYKLSKYMERVLAQRGYIETEFGYRGIPDQPYKALNFLIQATVAGLMHTLIFKYFAVYSQARYTATIHDELLAQIPLNDLEGAKAAWDLAVASLNADLGWNVEMRTGWKIGNNFYEAK